MLNAQQAAQYLLNEGIFEHEGATKQDQYARRISTVAWKRALLHGANAIMPYVDHFVPAVLSTFPAVSLFESSQNSETQPDCFMTCARKSIQVVL